MPSVPEEGTEIGKRPGRAEKMRTKHVRVFPYDPEWKEEFHKIRRDLEAHLLACRGWVLFGGQAYYRRGCGHWKRNIPRGAGMFGTGWIYA